MDGVEVIPRGHTIGFLEPSAERLDRLGLFFEAQYPALLRFALFVCHDEPTAQDLVQDAFVKLYRVADRIDEATIGAYARTTIVNLSRSRFRRSRRETLGSVESPVAEHDPGARDEIWRALAGLSPRQRAVVALRFYEDLSNDQIADALGMSHGSVKKHMDRALKKLRETLGSER